MRARRHWVPPLASGHNPTQGHTQTGPILGLQVDPGENSWGNTKDTFMLNSSCLEKEGRASSQAPGAEDMPLYLSFFLLRLAFQPLMLEE